MQADAALDEELNNIISRFKGERLLCISEETWDRVEKDYEFAVVIKVCGGAIPNREGLMNVLKRLWRPADGTEYKEIAPSVMVINFRNEHDMLQALNGGPWLFNQWLILVGKCSPDLLPNEVNIYHFNMWVQLHNVPLACMQGEASELLDKLFVEVLQVHNKPESVAGEVILMKFVRALVKMDIRNPIIYGALVGRRDKEPFWVEVKYEKLPRFCFKCGMFTHEEASCARSARMTFDDGSLKFGSWLKVGHSTMNYPLL